MEQWERRSNGKVHEQWREAEAENNGDGQYTMQIPSWVGWVVCSTLKLAQALPTPHPILPQSCWCPWFMMTPQVVLMSVVHVDVCGLTATWDPGDICELYCCWRSPVYGLEDHVDFCDPFCHQRLHWCLWSMLLSATMLMSPAHLPPSTNECCWPRLPPKVMLVFVIHTAHTQNMLISIVYTATRDYAEFQCSVLPPENLWKSLVIAATDWPT